MKIKDRICIFIIIIMPALIFGVMGKTVEMGLMIVASSICCAFFNIEKFVSFKGAGFEAKLKDTINDAYATINTLKEMSKPLILSTLNQINWSGRAGGLNHKEKQNLKNDIEKVIDEFKIEDNKIGKALDEFYGFIIFDFYIELVEEICKRPEIKEEQSAKLMKFYDRKGQWPLKENILDIANIKDTELTITEQKKLKDYVYYLENHKLPE